MKIKYQSRDYSPDHVTARYVCKSWDDGMYDFCETNADRRDIRQGSVPADAVPEAIRAAADLRFRHWPPYVSWPF